MSIVSFREMLADARRNRYAVPMFDLSNTTMIRAAAESAEELGSPVIFAAIWPDLDGSLLGYWANAARYAATQVKVPVALHLDHATTIEQCRKCADAGFQSVMIDASTLPLGQNIAGTGEIVELCSECNVSRAGELGHVGAAADEKMSDYTDVAEAARFAEATGVSALAVMVETAHGIYNRAPVLDIQRIRDLSAAP